MPYLDAITKQQLDDGLIEAKTAGELTYLLYKRAVEYLLDNTDNYQTRAEILGALTSTAHEFYRREVAPYEDIKIQQNGDLFDEYRPPASEGGEASASGDPVVKAEGANCDRVWSV